MANFIKNFDETKAILQAHLVDYLKEKGVQFKGGKILCLNPQHAEKAPSMSLGPNGQFLYCFGCSQSLDIFHVAHYLDAKPLNGPGWLQENFLWLANKYGLKVEFNELSEEDAWRLQVYRVLSDIANIISLSPYSKIVEEEIKYRGLDEKFCRTHHIGSIKSWEHFKNLISELYPIEFLQEIDIIPIKEGDSNPIFKETNLIYVVKDESGRPVGFAARDLLWSTTSPTPKYVNSRTTGVKVNIYEKDKRLYGLHHYLNTRKGPEEPLYIFEGYSDWAAAVSRGIHNCASIGGTAFTDKHVRELLRLDVKNVIITLDGDKVGQEKVKKILDEKFAGISGINVSVVILPDDTDPDDYIRQFGIEKFARLEKHDAFHWRLLQYQDRIDPVRVCQELLPYIVSEVSPIQREAMVVDLAKHTGFTAKAIMKEVDRLSQIQSKEINERRESIINNGIRLISRDPNSAETALVSMLHDLKHVSAEYAENIFSLENYLNDIQVQKAKEEEVNRQLGFNLGELSMISRALAGDWERDVVIALGGKPNSGKTALMSQMALEIALNNDDITVLFLTIDDSGEILTNRLLCLLAVEESIGSGLIVSMNKLKNPQYYVKEINYGGENSALIDIRARAYSQLSTLVKSGKLVVKDQSAGRTLAFAKDFANYYRERFPKNKILLFIDNFHKLDDFRAEKDERVRFKKLGDVMKYSIACDLHIPILCTMEYTKLLPKIKPSNSNIAETVSLEYNCNAIFHLYNSLADYQQTGEGEDCNLVHEVNGEHLPIVELYVGKNKISSFKGNMYMKFFPDQNRMESITGGVAEELIRQKAPMLKPYIVEFNNEEAKE